MIKITNVSYSYSDIKALVSIDLQIGKGESVALLGANGTGKSTLIKLICGILSPTEGSYMYDGDEITLRKLRDSKFAKAFHQRIGLVFQNADSQLFCESVFDEIAFGPRQMGMKENKISARVNDCLELLGIKELRHRQPYHLSGGEKRKVAIASALSLNPEVLILDEPMSGLDLKTQRWLTDFLQMLSKSGKTIIIATHNFALVREISERAVLFGEDHGIAADMPAMELIEDIELLRSVNFL